MRVFVKMPVILLILIVVASSVHAQDLPKIAIDSSFKIEFLLGQIYNRYQDPSNPAYQQTVVTIPPASELKIDLDPQFLVLSGMVELSPIPAASGRLAGSLSVSENSIPTQRVVHPTAGNMHQWTTTPNFGSWEVAGLLHLWNAQGYRFSITAGYRNEKWVWNGEPDLAVNGSLRDEFTSSIPFIGLQTSMLFPWWKTRFEVIGSPFMSRTLDTTQGNSFLAHGTANRGGLVEFQVEGSMGVTPSLFLGVNACYSFQEVYGNATAAFPLAAPPNTTNYNLYMSQGLWRTGFDINIVF